MKKSMKLCAAAILAGIISSMIGITASAGSSIEIGNIGDKTDTNTNVENDSNSSAKIPKSVFKKYGYEYKSHYYMIFEDFSEETGYEDIQQSCKQFGGSLCKADTKAEMEILNNYIKESGYESVYYIGCGKDLTYIYMCEWDECPYVS